jgi:hypothetical protein
VGHKGENGRPRPVRRRARAASSEDVMSGSDLIRFCDDVDAKLAAIAARAREASEQAHQALTLIAELHRAVAEMRRVTFASTQTQIVPVLKEGQQG